MDGSHVDRQPPKDEAEEREQDRIIDESGEETEMPTQAADPDVDVPAE